MHLFHLIAMIDAPSYYAIITAISKFYRYVKENRGIEKEAMNKFCKKIERSYSYNSHKRVYHLLPNGNLHGSDQEWWGGNCSYLLHYYNGKRDGKTIIYYPSTDSEDIRYIIDFKDGLLHGKYQEYSKDGKLLDEGYHKDGKKEGEWKGGDVLANFHNGVLHGKWFRFYSDGKVWYEGSYDCGKKCGEWKSYDLDGVVTIQKYKKDVLLK